MKNNVIQLSNLSLELILPKTKAPLSVRPPIKYVITPKLVTRIIDTAVPISSVIMLEMRFQRS